VSPEVTHPDADHPDDGAARPIGLVTLIVGETGRSSGPRARARRPAGAGPGPGAPQDLTQWSSRWSPEGPGPVTPGCGGEPDLTLSLNPDDAQLVMEGQLAPSVAFMQGRLKTSGDNALLLRVLEWSATPAFADALRSWLLTPSRTSVGQTGSAAGNDR
jgi:hypothetical protein